MGELSALAVSQVNELSSVTKGANFQKTRAYSIPVINDENEFRTQVQALLGKRAHIFKNSKKTLAFGSCFAQNISHAMREMGRDVTTLVVTEDINSPGNNVRLLQRVFHGVMSRFSDELSAMTHVNYEQVKQKMIESDSLILTLGNIFHLEDNGEPTLHKSGELVAETFEETREYIRRIFDMLQRHIKARIYVSVSPVPISGYRGDRFRSVTEADTASKCQLHAALHSLLPREGVTYIPTFEIFKWFAPHESFATLKHPRHFRESLIGIVMKELT